MAIFLSFLTFISTLSGGLVGLKHKSRLKLILGFTAGVLLAVVAFDLTPEIMALVNETGVNPKESMLALVVGFLFFHIMEKILLIHNSQEELYGTHKHPTVGVLSALALSAHSFMDGIGIGLGFKVSRAIGLIVSLAVISHDFSDGLNTASLMLVHKNPERKAFWFVLLDATTPMLGAASTLFINIPDKLLVLYLGVFAGFLLYIGASEILPEAHSPEPSYLPLVMTLVGVIFIYFVTMFV